LSDVTRLSALDAAFLAAESPTTPMHVGSLAIFEGAPFHDESGRFRLADVRTLIDERLHLVPRFRQRAVAVPHGLGRPVWADDPAFDVKHHVRLVTLASPGTDRQLRALCESQHMVLLDRTRPLWELCFVDGVSGGRVALIEKVHHAMVDGVSGVDVATALLDLTPEVRRFDQPPWAPDPLPTSAALQAGAIADLLEEPWRFAQAVGRSVRHPVETMAGFAKVGWAATTLVSRQTIAPHSSINRPVGRERKYEVVRHTMAGIDEIRSELGGTVNDVVLAAVAGGIRELLLKRGESLDGRPLEALVPVSLRPDDEHMMLGNRVAAMLVPLQVDEPDARRRLAAVRAAVEFRKSRQQASVSNALLDTTDHWPAFLAAITAGLIHRQPLVNVVITNVPGPPIPLYAAGARMLEVFPIVPLGGNLDVSVGILSYNGQLTIGLFADATSCPDVAVLAEGIEKAFFEMHLLTAA
jgi:WS/DGAT/MGAT family acyltransferase